jgi:putative alpha-1,2-mannosidase
MLIQRFEKVDLWFSKVLISLQGIKNFDLNITYQAVKHAATTNQKHAGRVDLQDYIKLGYVPLDKGFTVFSHL